MKEIKPQEVRRFEFDEGNSYDEYTELIDYLSKTSNYVIGEIKNGVYTEVDIFKQIGHWIGNIEGKVTYDHYGEGKNHLHVDTGTELENHVEKFISLCKENKMQRGEQLVDDADIREIAGVEEVGGQ